MRFVSLRAIGMPVTAVLLVLSGCGNDQDAASPPPGRFCALVIQLDDTALATGASSTPGAYDGPPDAASRLVDQMGATLDEMETTAPSELRDDVEAVVDGLRRVPDGSPDALQSQTFSQANQRVQGFRQRSCPSGGGEGEL